jgi:hypothetical protein
VIGDQGERGWFDDLSDAAMNENRANAQKFTGYRQANNGLRPIAAYQKFPTNGKYKLKAVI